MLAVITLPYVLEVQPKQGGWRYAILAAMTSILVFLFKTNTFFYLSSVFILFFIIEKWWGKIKFLPFLLAIVISPVLRKIVSIWSFPIRLQLTEWAGAVLQYTNMDIQVSGNMLLMDGNSFSVDPACIGLKTVITSLVLGIVILAFFEKKHQQSFTPFKTILLMSTICLLAIVSNFIRLLALIIFHILPENPLHDLIGLGSMFVYVLIPFYFMVRYFSSKIKKEKKIITQNFTPVPTQKANLLLALLLIFHFYNGLKFLETPVDNIAALEHIHLDGFSEDLTPNGVLKLQNEEALIYVKAPVQFFEGSHDPQVCWKGSGYQFSEVKIDSIGGKQVYTGILKKDNDKLYTAWWFENTTSQTPHEWNWRWKSINGNGNFYMVNVNCTHQEILEKWVEKGVW